MFPLSYFRGPSRSGGVGLPSLLLKYPDSSNFLIFLFPYFQAVPLTRGRRPRPPPQVRLFFQFLYSLFFRPQSLRRVGLTVPLTLILLTILISYFLISRPQPLRRSRPSPATSPSTRILQIFLIFLISHFLIYRLEPLRRGRPPQPPPQVRLLFQFFLSLLIYFLILRVQPQVRLSFLFLFVFLCSYFQSPAPQEGLASPAPSPSRLILLISLTF